MRRLVISASAALTLGGCVSTYGGHVSDFTALAVRSPGASKEYRIIRRSDFVVAFPDKPSEVLRKDPRLTMFFSDRPVSYSNQPPDGYGVGRYFISYACGDKQLFKALSLIKSAKPTIVKLACS